MSKIISIHQLLEKNVRKGKVVAAEEKGPLNNNEHETKFLYDELFTHITLPDLSMLNLHHPRVEAYAIG